jgi:predicted MFS family arabinose efflux permease
MMASAAIVTFMFSATPFLIAEVADRFEIGRGQAGLLSVVQVGAFAVANVVLPRILQPSGRVFRSAAIVLMLADVASILVPGFSWLLASRVLSGLAAGALTWLAWSAAMRTPAALSSMSAIGPFAALVSAPILGALVGFGDRVMFGVLALSVLPLMFVSLPTFERRFGLRERSRSRSNRVLLAALCLLTAAGASLFVFEAVVAVESLGMSPFAASLGFSLNAGAGFFGAKLASKHRRPGVWLATSGPAAVLTVLGGAPVWFYVGMAWWGFAFWMGLPGVLQMLSARSLQPDERAGDAQGLMAFGRSIGPGIGGVLVDAGSIGTLAVAAGVGLTLSGVVVVGVQEGREALPPTDLRTVDRN